MLFAVNNNTKMHRPIQHLTETNLMVEYVAKADEAGWIECRHQKENPLPEGVLVDTRTACLPGVAAGESRMTAVFTSPSQEVNWAEATHYRVPNEALAHERPMAPEHTPRSRIWRQGSSSPMIKFALDAAAEPNLLNELVAAHNNLLDARKAYQGGAGRRAQGVSPADDPC